MEKGVHQLLRGARKGLAVVKERLGKLLATRTPRSQEVRSQRMCPFCGLITARSKAFCLECGKSLTGTRLGQGDIRRV
jgi:hypothetical protein